MRHGGCDGMGRWEGRGWREEGRWERMERKRGGREVGWERMEEEEEG